MAQTVINKDLTISDSTVKLDDLLTVSTPTIVAHATSDSPSIVISANYSETVIPINFYNGCNYADFFEVADNKITIKSNKVRQVMVSAGLMCYRGKTGYISIYLRKNGASIDIGRCGFVDWTSETVIAPPKIVDVQQGDYFDIMLGASVAGTYQLTYASTSTVLTLYAVDYDLD